MGAYYMAQCGASPAVRTSFLNYLSITVTGH
jgi:hypothetical protein